MLSVGIVGLPNVGKSTLFNALIAKAQAQTGKHPFTTIEKNVGVVPVPNETLWQLSKIAGIPKVTPATITFVDIAGLVKGAHQGEGLGNEFLGHIHEADLILHLIRFFKDETVAHVHQEIDPENDAEIVETELLLSDVGSLERQVDRIKKEKKRGREEEELLSLAQKMVGELNQGKLAANLNLSEKERQLSQRFNLLTAKPMFYVANVSESELRNGPKVVKGQNALTLCAKLEEELSRLPWVEQRQFLKVYDLTESAIEAVARSCYQMLDLATFYTIAGGKEAHAWAVKGGTKAPQAGGKIHSDFERGFIAAEVISATELLRLGSFKKARELGRVRREGKNYEVKDGDVVEFRFSV